MEDEIKRLKEELSIKVDAIKALEGDIQSLDKIIDSRNAEIVKKANDIQSLTNNINNLKRINDGLREKLESREKILKMLYPAYGIKSIEFE